MNTKQLELFITVADVGSFSKAENEEFISKQAILKQINSLEEEIGCRLFNRSSSGITLSEAGKVFYEGAKEQLRSYNELVNRVKNMNKYKNILRVSNVEHQTLLSKVTEEFAQMYPQIRIQGVIHPNHSGEWRVENDLQDVGETPYIKEKNELKVHHRKLLDLPYVAVVRRNHPLAKLKSVSLNELRKFKTHYIALMTPELYRNELIKVYEGTDHLCERMDVDNQVAIVYEVLNSDDVFLTPNPFVYKMNDATCVPLDNGWVQEYDIIYKDIHNPVVKKYITLAMEIFEKEGINALM